MAFQLVVFVIATANHANGLNKNLQDTSVHSSL